MAKNEFIQPQKSLLIDENTHKRIKNYCKVKGIKINFLTEKIFNDYLDEHEKNIERFLKGQ